MRKPALMKKQPASTRRFQHRSLLLLLVPALLFVLCGVFLTFALGSTVSTAKVSPQTPTAIPTEKLQQTSGITPIASQGSSTKQMGPQQLTTTPARIVSATPTLVPSTPQQTKLGVFPLSSGGPLPIPEGVLHPTNIARVMLHSTLFSVYAGSMTRNPQAGVLCVLQEDITTGALHLQMYQGPQVGGALTILAVQKNILKLTNAKMQGSFDLSTNTFRW